MACVYVIIMLCSVFDGGERASTSRVGRSGCFIGCCPPCDGLSYLGSVAGAQKWVGSSLLAVHVESVLVLCADARELACARILQTRLR